MSQSHILALLKAIPKGVRLFFTNPVLALEYARKLFFELVIFPFFSPSSSLTLKKKFGDVILPLDLSSLPREKKYAEFTKRIFFELRFGFYEIEIARAIKDNLSRGDVFIDAGASAGYFSALGASCVGKQGQVHSFEPHPFQFAQLRNLPPANPGYALYVNNAALGSETGSLVMSPAAFPDYGGTSLVPGFMEAHHIHVVQKLSIPVVRLDSYLQEHDVSNVRLIKIDVEGYEFPVLRGFSNYLEQTTEKPVIICEIHPSAYQLMGQTLEEFCSYMKSYGYAAYDIMNSNAMVDVREIATMRKGGGFNVLWKAV